MSLQRTLGIFGTVGLLTAFAAACGDDESAGGKGGQTATTSTSTTNGTGGSVPTGITIPGQTSPVSALYDENGILHLAGKTDEDCFAALGYFHAQNRFFFMDFVRNLVRGKLGGLVKAGGLVLERDYENRRFFSTADGNPLEEKLYQDSSPETKAYLDSYTRGVNAWIADMRAKTNGATLTREYEFNLIVPSAIRDWEPVDSTAVGLYVLNDLSNNSDSEIALGESYAKFPAELAPDLFSAKPVFDAFTAPTLPPVSLLGGKGGPTTTPSTNMTTRLAASRALLADAGRRMSLVGSGAHQQPVGDNGSNNWVVGPTRTADQTALLANDPHLPLTNPSIWFPVEIDAKSNGGTGSYHVAGSTFPGLPSVMVGHNENVAWGVTTAYWDLADVYLETMTDDNAAVLLNGNPVPIIEKQVSFVDLQSGVDKVQTFRWVPHHGPIVSEDPVTHTAVTVRWRGHEGGTDLDAFFGVARANTAAEAKTSIELTSSASQNFVVIDKAGSFGWYPFSKIPQRPWASEAIKPWFPVPGDGTAEWDAFVPYASLPQLTNPADGVIATANADMTGASADGDPLNDGQPALQAYFKADGTREQRILDLLSRGGSTHSIVTMNGIQGDTYSLYGEIVVPAVLDALVDATLSPEEESVVDALKSWAYTCPTGLDGSDPVAAGDDPDPVATNESIGCTAFHATFYALVNQALGDEITAADVSAVGADVTLVARALKDPASIASGELMWDDVATPEVETRADIILRAVQLAANRLAVTGDANSWRWGRMHTLSLRSIYDNFGLATYNVPPVAASGGLFTVNVANPRRVVPDEGMPWNLEYTSGASVRFVVNAKPDGLTMTYQLPGGADLHTDSPFYNNLLPKYLKNEAIPFPFGPGAVPNPAQSYTVNPR